jgi:hypothetical protein
MKITGVLVDMLVDINPESYGPVEFWITKRKLFTLKY